MQLFNIGDIVVINPNLQICSDGCGVIDSMLQYCGMSAEIEYIDNVIMDGFAIYHLKNIPFSWNDYMLIPKTKNFITIF